MTSKLTLYKGALRILGERKISTLTDDVKARRNLDDAWDEGAVDYCLGQGQWTFATRTQLLNASISVTPTFGLTYAFEKPSDWMATIAVCTDPNYRSALINYEFEAGFLYSDFDELYVKYVSNNSTYGGDYSLWSVSFVNYVQTYLAAQICLVLTQSKSEKDKLDKELKSARLIALNNDRQNKPAQFPSMGSWGASRLRGAGNRYYSATGNFPV